jgi:hypothetical protein
MADNSKEARDRAEARFKKMKETAREGEQARAQYDAAGQATREKTSRLRSLRLAKEASEKRTEAEKTPVAPKKSPRAASKKR